MQYLFIIILMVDLILANQVMKIML